MTSIVLDPLRVQVSPAGNGFVANASRPNITALGATAEEAVEKARVMALEVLDAMGAAFSPTLIVRLEESRRVQVVVQSVQQPFSLEEAGMVISLCLV